MVWISDSITVSEMQNPLLTIFSVWTTVPIPS
ncbi:hypothetical protein LEP1GSC124_4585, partial [Leptospira interrogans serovar Pyrogenes str. 200701872]